MKFIDLFAGVGGFRKGLELAGHECVGFCEWDKYATASYTSMHLITEEQREYLSTLDLKKRQKEILKEEYRNGEWYSNDIRNVDAGSVPRCDCWCFGAPCQDFSVAGKRAGLDGDRSSLIREVFRVLGQIEEEDRPEWLLYENVKGMFSSNRGFDYLEILLAMDELGYDIEWQIFNSKDWGVPQNRERVYTVGHLRRYGERKILPIKGTDGENIIQLIPKVIAGIGEKNFGKQFRQGNRIYDAESVATALEASPVGNAGGYTNLYGVRVIGHRDGYRQNTLIFDPNGITETLQTCGGDGREPHTIQIIGKTDPKSHSTSDIHEINGIMSTCCGRDYKQLKQVAIPVLTPERTEKRQNGRRFKENGEPSFTLTAQDRHGVAVKVKEATKQGYSECRVGGADSVNLERPESTTRRWRVGEGVANTLDCSCNQGIFVEVSDELTVYAIWYPKYNCYIVIRKLTPKECFRLQGWTDDYFEKAQFVNSDSQLYKQAGNGVTVNVVYELGKAIKRQEVSHD